MSNQIDAWHFLPDDSRLRFGKRIQVKPGMYLRRDPNKLAMCCYGLHASIKAIDALKYAPGNTVCRVKLGGKIIHDEDKLVASTRKVVWVINGESVLRDFARWCALEVIHLWDAPDIVREYLETGNEKMRAAARAATRAATRAAARAATGAAAREKINTKLEQMLTAEGEET